METVQALRLAGHECTELELPEGAALLILMAPSALMETSLPFLILVAPRPLELFAGLTSADGYETLISPLGPDPKVRPCNFNIFDFRLNRISIRKAVCF